MKTTDPQKIETAIVRLLEALDRLPTLDVTFGTAEIAPPMVNQAKVRALIQTELGPWIGDTEG